MGGGGDLVADKPEMLGFERLEVLTLGLLSRLSNDTDWFVLFVVADVCHELVRTGGFWSSP